MNDSLIRCAVYIRVSTAEQAMRGKSLQAQQEYLEAYAGQHGMTVVGVYADKGQTARKELKKRKAIHTLLRDVEADRIDVILFWKMDRWFRNVSDFYKVQDILDAHNVKWIATAEPHINLDTRDGRLQLNIMLSIGQNEVDTTSERIKFTVDSMISNGRLVWGENNVGFGYRIEYGKMIKDPETEHMADACFRYILLHKNKSGAVKYMRDTFHIDFTYTMLRTMLSSEFYIGKYRENHHYCPAYLTGEQWRAIQEINAHNIRKAASGRIYYFSGLIHCPCCGAVLCGSGCSSIVNRRTGEKRSYCYYRCNNNALNHSCAYSHKLSQRMLEQALLDCLRPAAGHYQAIYKSSSPLQKPQTKKRATSAVNAEMNRLNLLFQKGRIPLAYYNEEYARLEKELSETESLPPVTSSHSHISGMLGDGFAAVYSALTESSKQAFWHSLIRSISISGKEISSVDFRYNVSD